MSSIITGSGITTPELNGTIVNENGVNVATDNEITPRDLTNGSATFTNTDNNISLTGIGIGVEVGDVLQVSGSSEVQ